MDTIVRWRGDPGRCSYLTDRICRQEYIFVGALDPDEYMAHLLAGWRRFGRTLFRPRCPRCVACRSLRVDAARFRPDRSQRRCRKANVDVVRLCIGTPSATPEHVALFDRFHADRTEKRGWSPRDPDNAAEYAMSFVDNPFPTQEWRYYLEDVLVGVGYVDELVGGLSAIYFAYDPTQSNRALGTWHVLSMLDRASNLRLPHVYLGYYVSGCISLQYKSRFRPNQILDADGTWHDWIAPD